MLGAVGAAFFDDISLKLAVASSWLPAGEAITNNWMLVIWITCYNDFNL